ncbi:MAG: sigma-54-dependent Fis family transcriptional regulator [Clostridiales bacterium]|nr:MAG: sigma-54-dependent Fis family transcriptional regulator [Clostridiales bacterium]
MDRALDKIINATHDAMIAVDMDGIITLYNSAAEKLTGKLSGDVLGKQVVDVVENTRLPIVVASGVAEVNQRQLLGDIEIITSRLPIVDDGVQIGAVAIFRDVSEMVQLAEELTNLKELQMTMQAVFNATQDAISVVNREGIHILVNPAYSRLTGYRKSEVLGKDYNVDLVEGTSVHARVLESGKAVSNAVIKTGKMKKDVVASAAPIVVDGQVVGSVAVIRDLTDIRKLTTELDRAKQIIRNLEAKYTFDDIKGESLNIKDAIEKAKIAAITPATVILRGESGTGKELFAHAIHNASNRKYAQFVRVNCAAISDSILESELFGYVEGAFTGALKGGRMGLFERASGGTLFLDEIGEIGTRTQLKLLRAIQEKEIVRVGGTKPIAVDVRIISATHVDLEAAVKAGTFREDLYYRLNVIPISIPALRDRLADIDVLAMHIIAKYNREYGRNIQSISNAAIAKLKKYDWQGNIRELENYIGRTMIQMKIIESEIEAHHLPSFEQKALPILKISDKDYSEALKLSDYMQYKEAQFIVETLEKCDGNRSLAAEKLGISIRSLYYKLQKLKIK